MKKYLSEKKLTNDAKRRVDVYLGFVYGINDEIVNRLVKDDEFIWVQNPTLGNVVSAIDEDWDLQLDLVNTTNSESVMKPLSTALLRVGALSILPDWAHVTEEFCGIFHDNKLCLAACVALNSIIRHIMRGPIDRKMLDMCTQSCRFIVPAYKYDEWDNYTNRFCDDIRRLKISHEDNVLKTLGCVVWAVRKYITNSSVELVELFDSIRLMKGGKQCFVIIGGIMGCLRGFEKSNYRRVSPALNSALLQLLC